jgi:hypothetical protein
MEWVHIHVQIILFTLKKDHVNVNQLSSVIYKRDEVTGGWRKLHNEGHHKLHSSPNTTVMIK